MQATIMSYRRGRHTQTDNQVILSVEKVTSKDDAQKLVGKSVTYTTSSGKELVGKVTAIHGNSGAVRALFETGMPGQSLGSQVALK